MAASLQYDIPLILKYPTINQSIKASPSNNTKTEIEKEQLRNGWTLQNQLITHKTQHQAFLMQVIDLSLTILSIRQPS
jgi:hypothetical protein